jgi:predicted transcriptional regulator
MKYRSRMEIIAMIILSAKNGATKTKLMYSAYLSYSQLKEYLAFLVKRDLLFLDEESQLFRPTERGLHFLNVYDEVKDMVSIYDEERFADKRTIGAEGEYESLHVSST